MKIVAFNGSPKAEKSVTYTYFEYLMKHMLKNEYKVFHITKELNKLENDETKFQSVMDAVNSSDSFFWVTPVQSYNIPSQLKRFIELIFEKKADKNFHDKYATTLTTSIHVMDHAAHNYLHAISEDMGMRYIAGYSASMMDLMEEKNRKTLISFAKGFFEAVKQKKPVERLHQPINSEIEEFIPSKVEPVPLTDEKVVILADIGSSTNLDKMVDTFKDSMQNDVNIIDINKIRILGPCLACLKCTYDGHCVYRGKDDVYDVFNEVDAADVVVNGMSIKDRWYSSRFKLLFDRSFFQNHKPRFKDKQVAYIVSGPLRSLPYLRETLESAPQLGLGGLAGIVTDENGPLTTSYLNELAKNIAWRVKEGYIEPPKFFGVGAYLIYRDIIYNNPVLAADYKLFKESGYLNYPQNEIKTRIYNFAFRQGLRLKSFRKNVYASDMPSMVVKPFKEILEND
jgi:multimeric flavodoxin WrbA